MKKYLLGLVLGLIPLTGCFQTADIEPSFRSDISTPQGGMQPPPNFAQFKDIPIPEKASMDLKRTLLFGSDPLIGRLVFNAPYNQTSVFDFYMLEMPKFGWKEITVIRSQNSIMTFERDNRIATIQLSSVAVGGTDVLFDISFAKNNKSY